MGEVPAGQENILKRVRKSIDSLLTLINDWLDLSKIEKGRLVNTFESISPSSLLRQTIESLQPLAEEMNVTVTLQPEYEDVPGINGDPQSLRQLFANLINNAIKFNRRGGNVTVVQQVKDSFIDIVISDTGIGISGEDLPLIFDVFYRVRHDETQSIPGTGLGLSIARKIAEAHSATITVKSQIGEGTTFTLRFPTD